MLDKSFGLHFYLKKPKDYVKGIIPIYFRITVDGIPKELSTKRLCKPNRWNPAAERAFGTKEDARALNAYLDTLQAKAYEAGKPTQNDPLSPKQTVSRRPFQKDPLIPAQNDHL